MQALYHGLRSQGLPDGRIHAESFGPAGLKRDSVDTNDSAQPSSTPVAVTFARSGETLLWSPTDGTLLDLGAANGLPLAASCRNGRCGTCRVPLAQGEVVYMSTPPAGVTQGTALLCQAVPAEGTKSLVLSA
jgi:ferredoxin